MELEDRVTVANAEGIDLELVLSGIGSRALALTVDIVVQLVLIFVLGLVAGSLGDAGVAGAAVGAFVVMLGYHIVFEAFNGGQTLGKAWLGIAAVNATGGRLTFLQSVIRNVVRFIDILPGTYLVGLVAILATERNQRVGDLAAGTLVIRRPRVRAVVPQALGPAGGMGSAGYGSPGDGQASPDVGAGWDLSAIGAEEVAAMREFLARRGQLSPEARAQIADQLARPVLGRTAGMPLDGGPEAILERVVQAKYGR